MKRIIIIIFGIIFSQAVFGAQNMVVWPFHYSMISVEDMTVKVVGVFDDYNEEILTIPSQMEYNHKIYTVTEIGDLRIKAKTLEIPETIEDILDNRSFQYSRNLERIMVDVNNPVYASEDGILYTKNKETLLSCPAGRLEDVTIPESVNRIEEFAFFNCAHINSITLPQSLTAIETYAFAYCTSLETISIPNSVTQIGHMAFVDCPALKHVELSNSVEELEFGLFERCSSLTSITIPSSVKEIHHWVFLACTSLKTIYIPASVEKINHPFPLCPNLTSIIIDEENPNYCAENGIIYNKDKTILVGYPSATGKVEVQEGIIEIGEYAFEENTNLTYILLPASIKSINADAFYDCYSLETVVLLSPTPPELGLSVFGAEAPPWLNPNIFVPDQSIDLYREAPEWSKRKDNIFSIDKIAAVRDNQIQNETKYRVFSVQGTHILSTDNADALRELPSGIFIVNGKKVMVP